MKIHFIWVMLLIDINRYSIVCLPLRASQWCTLSKVKIHLIWVMQLIDINRYSIVCLQLRASQWCTLEGEDTFYMGDATDRHQPIQHRVSPVKGISMVHPLEGEDTFDMGDATDRHQPIQHRVSPVNPFHSGYSRRCRLPFHSGYSSGRRQRTWWLYLVFIGTVSTRCNFYRFSQHAKWFNTRMDAIAFFLWAHLLC